MKLFDIFCFFHHEVWLFIVIINEVKNVKMNQLLIVVAKRRCKVLAKLVNEKIKFCCELENLNVTNIESYSGFLIALHNIFRN